MKRIARLALFVLSIISIGFFNFVSAQEEPASQIDLCPDYGDKVVDMLLSTPAEEIASGAILPVRVRLENRTDQPLSNGVVLVKLISRAITDEKFSSAEGVAVARVVALNDVSLSSNGSIERDFALGISDNLPSGTYDLQAAYLLSSDFNLENPDVDLMGSQNMAVQRLKIHNPSTASFAFIDGASLRSSERSLSATLRNPSATEASATVLWKVYSWNALSEKAVLESKVEQVVVPARGSKAIAYEIQDNNRSLYQVVAQIDSKGTRSIATILVNNPKGETIIKLAGVTPFPSEDGMVQAYACLHNVYSDDETQRNIHLAVNDSSGRLLGEGMFPAPTGVNEFEVSKLVKIKGGDIMLVASVLSSGAIEQIVTRTFKCEDFGGCFSGSQGMDIEYLFALTMLAAGTGGLITMRYYLKHNRHRTVEPPTNIPS